VSADLSTPEGIVSATVAGTLLNAIAAAPYVEEESLADELAKLHNTGVIDILKIYRCDELDTVSGPTFFRAQGVFCKILPQVECPVEDATATCKALFDKANGDHAAALVYKALRNWFKLDDQRLVKGLAWIRRDMTIETGITHHVLVAGATRDSSKFVGEALDLSRQSQSHVRLDALHALGQMELPEDDETLALIIQRFNDSLESPSSDREAAVAIGAALRLVERLRDECVCLVEPLLVTASRIPAPEVRYAIASGLQTGWRRYTTKMTDVSFEALQNTKKDESATLRAIDATLGQWDLGGDQERVISVLKGLMSADEDAVDLGALPYFQHRISEQPGHVLGWYVVSLLLTGDHRLCTLAERLLPYSDVPNGLEVDLTPFALDTAWILFLARKTLGYLFLRQEAATAVLLSCLRAVPDNGRAELEQLISYHLLVNYPSAITQMETAIIESDAAQVSVSRLVKVTEQYFRDLERLGTCEAFRPSERARQLQGFRQADLSRRIQKQAMEQSIMSQLVHRSTLLYGTGMIFHAYAGDGSNPRRQETSMASFEHQVEIPRLELIDPVGLRFALFRFRLEPRPQ